MVQGSECVVQRGERGWFVQKWVCDVLSAPEARNYHAPDKRLGEIRPTVK